MKIRLIVFLALFLLLSPIVHSQQKLSLASSPSIGIPDSWMVQLAPTVTAKRAKTVVYDLARRYGMRVRKDGLLIGGQIQTALLTGSETSARRLASDPHVQLVEQDRISPVGIDGKVHYPDRSKLNFNCPKLRKGLGSLTDESATEANVGMYDCEWKMKNLPSGKFKLDKSGALIR